MTRPPPWQNPFVESFHHAFATSCPPASSSRAWPKHASVIGDWHEDYTTHRPHSSLGVRTPFAFAAHWTRAQAA